MPPARTFAAVITTAFLCIMFSGCGDQRKYEQGISDSEIKIGNTSPYSGPLSAYGTIGRATAAYFDMINEQGGVNGRKINFISLDDGYSPPKTVEQIRKLVEEEQVAFLSGTLGTPTNSAVHEYVNAKGIPQLFIQSGASKWGDPENHPWTMGWTLNYLSEATIYGRYLVQNKPDARIAVLYQNDDYGKDLLHGLKLGLGDQAESMIVATASYEVTDPTVDSQIVSLKDSGANTLFTAASAKFAAQVIRKVYDIGWKPLHILNAVSISVASVLEPAGLDKSVGIISVGYMKDPSDPQWKDDPDVREYKAWFEKYYPTGNINEIVNVAGYSTGWGTVKILERCGDDLSRANIMKQAASFKDVEAPLMLPGIKWNTAADDYYLIESAQFIRFDGKQWQAFGEVIGN